MTINETPKPSVEELFQSLTGFDELAIKDKFGIENPAEVEHRPIIWTRALVFIIFKRDGMNSQQAYQAAMETPSGILDSFFADDPEDVLPDDPDSEPGKDSTPLELVPSSSPAGASSPGSHQPSITS